MTSCDIVRVCLELKKFKRKLFAVVHIKPFQNICQIPNITFWFYVCLSLQSRPSRLSSAIDCVMSEWSEWSECNKSCGKGHTIRTRTAMLEPQFGGDPCSETIQRKKCKIRKCNRGQPNSDEKRRRKEQREKRRSKQGRSEVTTQHPGWHHRHRYMDSTQTNISEIDSKKQKPTLILIF